MVNIPYVKESGLRLPVTSENDSQHSNSNQTENDGSENSYEKLEGGNSSNQRG